MLKAIIRLICTILFTVFCFTGLQAQGWNSAYGNATVNTLNDVQFVTDQVAYAVGNLGTVLRSSDGGETWSDVSYGDTKDLQSLLFFDKNTGYIGAPFSSGDGGSTEMLAKTTDGGQTWEIMSEFFYEDFIDMEFIDDQNGWVASVDGKIIFTKDGGENWSSTSAGSEDLHDIHIKNDSTYWVAGDFGSLYSSSDYGENWELAVDMDSLGHSEFGTDYFYFNGVEFLDESIGFAVGRTYDSRDIGFIIKTTDGGESWTRLPDFEHVIRDIEIGDAGEIILAGGMSSFTETQGNAINISLDEGETWKSISDGDGPLKWTAVDYNGTNGIAVGETGAITTFTASSDTLEGNILTGLDIADFDFYDKDHGVVATGGRNRGYQGTLFMTADGGQTWEKTLSLEGQKNFSSVSFATQDFVWAVGTEYFPAEEAWQIFRSYDAGANWIPIEVDLPDFEMSKSLQKVYFIDAQTGFIKAQDNLIKTEDGGATWNQLDAPDDYSMSNFSSFHFVDEDYGWMVGNDVIAATTDGGNNWVVQYEEDSQSTHINEVFFANETTGYVVKDRGDILKTEDGGETWEDLSTFSNFDLTEIDFITADTGVIAGDYGTFITTVDGGENFIRAANMTRQDIYDVGMLDEENFWIAGEGGFFASTTNGGQMLTSAGDPIASSVPSKIRLEQNYPNPFNPTTQINFELHEPAEVDLRVYDLMGREIAILVNEQKSAGSHQASFQASGLNLASGLYLYKLEAGSSVITKKMMLVK
ncbi:MAG: YCF48-related protein [Balneolales bacterium]